MAASVDNRQFHLNGVVSPFKSSSIHRSDSPIRPYNLPSSNQDFSRYTKKPVPTMEDDSSSEDEADYKDLIRKTNSELEPSVLDSRDEGTTDNWVERNPTMVRLTGKHPFNAEPSLDRLMHHGFITPVPLHYVRNHGVVPKATWQDSHNNSSGVSHKLENASKNIGIRRLVQRDWEIQLQHVHREGNQCADLLASLAVLSGPGVQYLQEPPPTVLPSLFHDQHGALYRRSMY